MGLGIRYLKPLSKYFNYIAVVSFIDGVIRKTNDNHQHAASD